MRLWAENPVCTVLSGHLVQPIMTMEQALAQAKVKKIEEQEKRRRVEHSVLVYDQQIPEMRKISEQRKQEGCLVGFV